MVKKLLFVAAGLILVIGVLLFLRGQKKEPSASAAAVSAPIRIDVPSLPTVAPTPEATATPSPSPDPFDCLAPTTRMSFEELVGDNGNYDMPAGYPEADTYRIIVDIYHQVVLVYAKDAYGEYTVPVRYMLCSTGLHDSTPTGSFQLKCYRVRFGFFSNDGTYGQYWTLINGRIYFHSTLYSEREAASYIEQTYRDLGKPASHGCIRLTVPDARFIFYNCAQGTSVEIRSGSEEDLETEKIRERLLLAECPQKHLSLQSGEIPFTDTWSIDAIPHSVPYIQGSQKHQK